MKVDEAGKSFYDNFEHLCNEKIALYGLSEKTEVIIKQFGKQFNICGLLDGFLESGFKFGKKIISLGEVVTFGITNVIIIARTNSTKIIFNRIKNFCISNNINVYDENGNDLINVKKEMTGSDFSGEDFENVKNKIDSYRVISFDIFDTLVCRKTILESDIFEIIYEKSEITSIEKKRYIQLRCQAERNYDKILDIYEIYDYIKENGNISVEEREKMLNAELQFEKNNIIVRRKVLELFNYAKSIGKKIYLVSDMYFDSKQLKEILNICDVKGYEDIIVSCEYNKEKKNGLFSVLLEHAGCRGNDVLHIGDSIESDILPAEEMGISVVKINSIYDMLETSVFKNIFDEMDIEERLLLGISLSVFFNNPFKCTIDEKIVIENAYEFSYMFLAPVINSFVIWMTGEVKKNHFTDILFSARDGWLISKLYNEAVNHFNIKDLPVSHYFYTSRIAVKTATLYNDEDVGKILSIPFDGNLQDILEMRLGLSKADIMTLGIDNNDEKWHEKEEFAKKILSVSKEHRNNYLNYIGKMNLGENIMFFDFVSAGTCHEAVQRLINKEIKGLYFIRVDNSDTEKQKLNVTCYTNQEEVYFNNYFLLEYVISSPEPTLIRFNDMGTPILGEEFRDQIQLKRLNQMQEAVFDYFREITKYDLNKKIVYFDNYSKKIYKLCSDEYLEMKQSGVEDIVIRDDFYKREFKLKI